MGSPDPGVESRWWSRVDGHPPSPTLHQGATCSGPSTGMPSTSQGQTKVPSDSSNQKSTRNSCQNKTPQGMASVSQEKGSVEPSKRNWKRDRPDRKRNGRRKESKRTMYGHGETQTVVEEDNDTDVWKVSPVQGSHFSAAWLEAVASWAREYCGQRRETILEAQSGLGLGAADQSQCSQTVSSKPDSQIVTQDAAERGDVTLSVLGTPSSEVQSVAINGESSQKAEHVTKEGANSGSTSQKKGPGRVRLSVRLEHCGLNDQEVQMLADWSSQHGQSIEIVKLWLFDNQITDIGAKACAQMLHEGLLELHLSHNFLTVVGILDLLSAIPTARFPSHPLWLRVEWNMVGVDELVSVVEKLHEEKSLIADIPGYRALRDETGRRVNKLVYGKELVHVRLPWCKSQRTVPVEGLDEKASSTTQAEVGEKEASRVAAAAADNRLKGKRKPHRSGRKGNKLAGTSLHAVPEGMKEQTARKSDGASPSTSTQGASTCQNVITASVSARGGEAAAEPTGGPLLLFPDVGVLLTLIGAVGEADGSSAPVSFEWLEGLRQKGRFGSSVSTLESIIFVICASVTKQLHDSRQQGTVTCPQELFEQSMARYGQEGSDFVCVLDALESENGDVQGAGSSGEAGGIDHSIIDAALLFQRKIARVTGVQSDADNAASASPEGTLRFHPDELSVILLSDNNAQLLAAKERGVPASSFRELSGFVDARVHFETKEPFASSIVRKIVGRSAVRGLNPLRPPDLQQGYDGAMACLKELLDAHESAAHCLGHVKKLLIAQDAPNVAIDEMRTLFDAMELDRRPKLSGGGEGSGARSLFESHPQELVFLIREKMLEWNSLVKSHQTASHILRPGDRNN